LTAAKFKPIIFSLSSVALSNAANIYVLVILQDFRLFSA
jgi:hypothetical protein